MELALTTVVLLVALAPGVIFWNSYFSGRFTRQTFSASPLVEIVSSLGWAVVFDLLGIGLLNLVRCLFRAPTISSLFAASPRYAMVDHWWELVVAALAVMLLALLIGSAARRLVWTFRWDLEWPILQTKHEWYYLLLGRIRGFSPWVATMADVLAEHPDDRGSRLFRGRVVSFQLTPSGTLREIVLADAMRSSRRGEAHEWKPIPGDKIVLLGPMLHSINLTYSDLKPEFEDEQREKKWVRERRWAALRYEEP